MVKKTVYENGNEVVYEFETVSQLNEYEAQARTVSKKQEPMTLIPTLFVSPQVSGKKNLTDKFFWHEEEDAILHEFKDSPNKSRIELKKAGYKRTMAAIYVRRKKLGLKLFNRKKSVKTVSNGVKLKKDGTPDKRGLQERYDSKKIIEMIGKGMSTAQIAQKFNATPKQIYDKIYTMKKKGEYVPASQKPKRTGNFGKSVKRMKWVSNRAKQLCDQDKRFTWESARLKAMGEWKDMGNVLNQPTMPQPQIPTGEKKNAFPDFPDLTPQSIVRLKEICAHAAYGTPITYATAEAYLSLEEPLTWTPKLWDKFKADFLVKSKKILDFFKLEGSFKVSDDKIIYSRV